MTKDEWRTLDKTPGAQFRLIADGRIGKLMRCHKDAAVLRFNEEREHKDEKYCPCEMLMLPDAPWEKPKSASHPYPRGRHRGRLIEKVCPCCGGHFITERKDARFCSRRCRNQYASDAARKKWDEKKPENWESLVKWNIARGITKKAGAALCHVPVAVFTRWVKEYREERGSGDAE